MKESRLIYEYGFLGVREVIELIINISAILKKVGDHQLPISNAKKGEIPW